MAPLEASHFHAAFTQNANFRRSRMVSGKNGIFTDLTCFHVAFTQNANSLTTDMLTSLACS